jgi:N-acetyl sugar amidotransferase
MENNLIKWCKNCMNMSTRPRITFDERGWCNACQWMEEKKVVDWESRQNTLRKTLLKYKNDNFKCIVPVSGGKDGSYVSHTIKNKYKINPLTVTVRPALSLEIGDQNLTNFINSGYSHIHITPNPSVLSLINKLGFIHMGFPYYGWLIAIFSCLVRTANYYDIKLIIYGEDGEVEYGGSNKTKDIPFFDISYMKKIYTEGGYDYVIKIAKDKYNVPKEELSFFEFPSEKEIATKGIKLTHMSYFEPWDSYKNYLVAKESCGLIEKNEGNKDTFTNFAQNDQALYSLHTYLMYLKFGFGRATQDCGIEIRRGAMTREQAINLIKLYDNSYPFENLEIYLDYFKMKESEFNSIIDKYANKNLFKKIKNRWEPKFEPGNDFKI